MPTPRLLVFSHPCVVPVNRRLFSDLQRLTHWDVTLVMPSNWRDEYGAIRKVAPDETSGGFEGRIIALPVVASGNIPLHLYRGAIGRLLARERPQVLYMHHEPYGFATAQLCALNALTVRAAFGFYSAQNLYKRYPLPVRLAERGVFRSSRFAFPITDEVLAVLRQRGYRGPAEVLPLAIDTDIYHRRAVPEAVRAQIGAQPGETVIGYAGRITEEKGLKTLLRALARLAGLAGLPWRLVVIGTGPDTAAFNALAGELGIAARIAQLGYVPHEEVAACFSALDLFVLPSETRPHWKEQFGRVLIEALACGVPVVGSDSGSIPEIIGATGGGLVFPEGDAEALAAALRALIESPQRRRAYAEAGGRRARTLYSQKAVAERMAQAITQVLPVTPVMPGRTA